MPDSIPISERSPFRTVANALLQSLDAAVPRLRELTEDEAGKPRATGKWSSKQVIGHLIDSAANNHQRFVRAQEGPELVFSGYSQDHWVASQHYQDRRWEELLELWRAYNSHLAHVIAAIDEVQREVRCTIGTDAPVTLGFLTYDYLVHLRHHLKQLGVR
jgi:hypothetical protein